MNQIIQEFIQYLSIQFHSHPIELLKQDPIHYTINQTYFGSEILIGNQPNVNKMITYQSKLVLEPILHEIYTKYTRLFFLLRNETEEQNNQSKYQFISSLFEIDKCIQSSTSSHQTKLTMYTSKQQTNFQLFVFKQQEPIMDFTIIEELVNALISIPIDPFVFINNQFVSSCSLSPIGAIIIECNEFNQTEILQLFKESLQALLFPVSIDSTLIEKVSFALNAIIQSSSNDEFRNECNMLLNNNSLVSLRSLISGCCYDNYIIKETVISKKK